MRISDNIAVFIPKSYIGLMDEPRRRDDVPEWTQADRLRKAREHAKLHQTELAKLIGTSSRTIGRYEDGIEPKRAVLIAWAVTTGVSQKWLETGQP